jgi:hypothetical protein
MRKLRLRLIALGLVEVCGRPYVRISGSGGCFSVRVLLRPSVSGSISLRIYRDCGLIII